MEHLAATEAVKEAQKRDTVWTINIATALKNMKETG